jgi:hypothetical protein
MAMIFCLFMTLPVPVWGAFSGTVDVRVDNGNDDAEQQGASAPNTSSSDLEMVDDDGNDQIIGIRFTGIPIPQGSTITNAYIKFTADGNHSNLTNLVIYGEDAHNPPNFASGNISGRTTIDSVAWNNVPSWSDDNEYQTPDLTAIVQKIVNLTDWAGAAMVFIITDSDPAVSGRRRAESHNGDSGRAPLLHIEYTSDAVEVSVSNNDDDAEEAGNGSMDLGSSDLEMIRENTDQTVGVRFRNVPVPQGSIITRAYLRFTTDETSSEQTDLTIHGQALTAGAPTAGVFTSSSSNISSRAKTSASVGWNDISAWNTVGEFHNSSDISSVVQEIVGSSYWDSGEDMVFIISGSGKRVAQSHNLSGGTPALLHIEFSQDPVPYISVDSTSFGDSFYVGGNADPDTLTITNTGTVSMTYSITDNAAWLLLVPSTGGTLAPGASDTIAINYTASGLAVGTHEATITIADTGGLATNSPKEVGVSLTVLPLPTGASCGNVPVYTENLVSPAILLLLDISGSMTSMMNVSSAESDPKTPDLSTIVQEIVDRPSWAENNSMVFIIEGTGERTAEAFDGESGSAALLHIEYSGGPADGIDVRVSQSSDDGEESSGGSVGLTSSDLELVYDGNNQTVGMRFQNVAVPQGATITEAYLQFVIDESNSEATSLTIYGEDLDDPPTFAASSNNISSRTKTTASVPWNSGTTPALEEWGGATQMSRIDIAKDALSELVIDRGISWGYGTWAYTSRSSADDYTLIHVGCKNHDEAHQTALQSAISSTVAIGGTPLGPSLVAAKKYFTGVKKDQDNAGDFYTSVSCQPMFLIDVTDGLGYAPDTSVAVMEANTHALADEEISAIAVGFGLSNATQIQAMAQVANARGAASDADQLYALHPEVSGVAQPFLANNKDELVDALSTITESVKAAIFHGSAPAPTTSADLGDTVLVANFDATDWSGELEAVVQAPDGEWDQVSWAAGDVLPGTRKVFTIDVSDHTTVIPYTDATLTGDNWDIWDSGATCGSTDKAIGDIINSTPIVVGSPSYYYTFDNYTTWKNSTTRDTVIYIGANDGALHAFNLADGVEKWAFVPESLHAKLEMATSSTYDMCSSDYCHQYFVDGSPQAGDIFDGTDWKTIVVTGLGEGGESYFAIDVTSGEPFDHASDPADFLWEYTDAELGETWTAASIARVDDGANEEWGVFFGSGYSTTDQANKQAYLYGIVADSAAEMWNDGSGATDRILVSSAGATGNLEFYSKVGDFTVGEVVTGVTSGAYGTITAANADSLDLQDIFGTFIEDETITDSVTGAALVYAALEGAKLDDALAATLAADLDADIVADHIYVGNLYGIMYRVKNIGKGQTPTVSKLFNFSPAKNSNNDTPIRAQAAFAYQAVADNIWVYFGTGRYEAQFDKTTSNQQYFFGLKDSLTSTDEYTYKVGTGLQLNGSDLVTLDADYVVDDATGTEVRIITGSNPSSDPWAVKLDKPSSGASERVIVKPLVAGGIVFFTTFIPDQDICAGNGDTWVYALDYATGLAPTDPVFDLNQDGVVDEQDKAVDSSGNVYNVAAVSVGAGQGSNPVLYKKTLFITTTGEGLEGLDVDVGDINVQLGSWKEKF